MTESTAAAARAVLLSDAPLLGRLYSDWLAGDPELSAALASPTLDPRQYPSSSSAAAGLGESAPDLWEAVLEQNRRLGASSAALELGGRLARGEAGSVVAGQQPGVLGGPAFSVYKLATAVALAERAAESSGA